MNEIRSKSEEDPISMSVTWMGFTAPSETIWQFVIAAVEATESDEELGHVAAGPIEYLLGKYGELFIEDIEERVIADPKFARALTGASKYLMSDEIWARIQAIQIRVPNPLPEYKKST